MIMLLRNIICMTTVMPGLSESVLCFAPSSFRKVHRTFFFFLRVKRFTFPCRARGHPTHFDSPPDTFYLFVIIIYLYFFICLFFHYLFFHYINQQCAICVFMLHQMCGSFRDTNTRKDYG